jgi:hypothetical protein
MSRWTLLLFGVSLFSGLNTSILSASEIAQIQQVSHSCGAPCKPACTTSCNTCQPACNTCQPACDTCNPCHVSNPCDPCSWCNSCSNCSHGMSWSDCVECNNDSPVLKYSTCKLYPHYAYYPKCHGYWHFRNYNWIHIDQHRMTLAGEDIKFPYSDRIFTAVYAEFEYPIGEVNSDQLTQIRKNRLPNLEDLLK